MKTILWLIFVLKTVGSCPTYAGLQPYNSATMNYEITPNQAVAVIRIWASDPALSLNLAGVYVVSDSPGSEIYIYRTQDRQSFVVGCHTGLVGRWTNNIEFDNYTALLKANQSTQLSQAQLEQSAFAFAQSHYPNFDQLKMQELSYDNGQVVFYSQPAPGVWLKGNICAVDVNNYTGKAFRYVAGRTNASVTVSTSASIPSSQAEYIALNWLTAPFLPGNPAYGTDPVLSAFTTQPSQLWIVNDSLGYQRLVWIIYTAKSTTIPNYTYNQWVENNYDLADSCEVGVDARTGAITTYNGWLGGKAPAKSHILSWHSRNAMKSAKIKSCVKLGNKAK